LQKVLLLFIAAAGKMALGKAAGNEAARMAAARKMAIGKAAGGEATRMAAAGKGYTWRRLGRWYLGRRRAARRIEWRWL
jgi:hypothetical protein